MEIDPRELSLAIDFLAVDSHDLELGAQQGEDAEVRRPLHPGLEEERAVLIEEPLAGAARFVTGQRRPIPFNIAGTPGRGEGRLDDPGRRGGPEEAVEIREGFHHPRSGQRAADLLRDPKAEGAMVDL